VEIARLGETSMTAEILLARKGEPVAEGELRYVFVGSGGDSTAPIPEPIRAGLARYQPEAV
jgi:acyl-CoA thioesterase FadM